MPRPDLMTAPAGPPGGEFLPQGAFLQPDGSWRWQLWAPRHAQVELVLQTGSTTQHLPMKPLPFGYFCAQVAAQQGQHYAYRLSGEGTFPDPASRWQPEGVHRPSALWSPNPFAWSDNDWAGIPAAEMVLYELHVGTFTDGGTFDAACARLPDLVDLGVNTLELLPLAQFAGERNWGYDGVYPYAVQHSYGGPAGLQRFVNAAHRLGLAVVLDVVYNHLGPEGNYLGQFGHYFSRKYNTPWGEAINYDGPHSDAVRRYFIDNALQWVRDFHLDGLRLDACQMIYDTGPKHLLAELAEEVQTLGKRLGRHVAVIAETDQNDPRILADRPAGFGLDAMWSDDLHHSLRTLLTREKDGYFQDYGTLPPLAASVQDGYYFAGRFSRYRRRYHGAPLGELSPRRLIGYIQNHDMVGNRAEGDRLGARVDWAGQRGAAAVLLLAPQTPMLFMGQEYGEPRPFPFFCSFSDDHLITAVREGRLREFAEMDFQWTGTIPDPHAETTFQSAKLTWAWPPGSPAAGLRTLYRDLLRARATWPELRPDATVTAACLSDTLLQITRRRAGSALTVLANLSTEAAALPDDARTALVGQRVIWSSEASLFGGTRPERERPELATLQLLPYEVLILTAADRPLPAKAAKKLHYAFGPVVAGMILDGIDLATFGPYGLAFGLPLGAIAGFWLGTALGLGPAAATWCAVAAGAYCMMPMTEFLPLATLVGAYVRLTSAEGEG